jgi:hypothetical protein
MSLLKAEEIGEEEGVGVVMAFTVKLKYYWLECWVHEQADDSLV